MESKPTLSKQTEQTEHTSASNPPVSAAENPKSSNADSSYAVIIKYDDCYMRSKDGILRLLHVAFVFLYLLLAVSGGTNEGDYLSLPYAWKIRLIVFTCVISLLVCIFIIGLNVTSTASLLPVDWQLFDIIVYGVLALLFFLTIILLGVDIPNSAAAEFIPPSTTCLHIAALVFGTGCLLLHGAVTALAFYQRKFADASSVSRAVLMSQQSSSSVTTA